MFCYYLLAWHASITAHCCDEYLGRVEPSSGPGRVRFGLGYSIRRPQSYCNRIMYRTSLALRIRMNIELDVHSCCMKAQQK